MTLLMAQRHKQILNTLADGGRKVADLAEHLGVSESTIRRDLSILQNEGLLSRKYGGAMLTLGSRENTTDSGIVEDPLSDSDQRSDFGLRKRMAKEAAKLVNDRDIVVLDVGSTTPLIARELLGRPLTIVTSNLAVLDVVREDEAIDVVLIGGVLRRNNQSLVGPLTEQAAQQISSDIMFLSCTGVRRNSVVDDMAVETPIKRALIVASGKVVLLASEKKMPGTGGMQLCGLDQVDTMITTSGAPEDVIDKSRLAGRKVIIA